MPAVAVVIPAYNEADRGGATVAAARALPGVDAVVVVDDGSRDATAAAAREAGARTLRYARNHGKAMAMMVGAREGGAAASALPRRPPRPPRGVRGPAHRAGRRGRGGHGDRGFRQPGQARR